MNYKNIRNKYPEFSYDNYNWCLKGNDLNLEFEYSVSEFKFKHKIVIKNLSNSSLSRIREGINNLVFNIGLVEIFNYWKTFCSPKIIIAAGKLDSFQKKWWMKLLMNSMGQYFYENKIDFTAKNFVILVNQYDNDKNNKINNLLKVSGNGVLVPIGGGKDSAVTLELVSKNFKDTLGLMVNRTKARVDTAKAADVKTVIVKRILDKGMISLNKKGYLNGHIPFTTVLSFVSILVAYITNKKYVAFSNEQSSNEGNLVYKNLKINHQYSKTIDLENDFRSYNEKYLTNITYFSFLRPIYDLQIAKIFSKFPKYFDKIVSCNKGRVNNKWCGKCSKCMSTFILFYPFLKDETIKIFGKNLLEDKSLKTMINNLTQDNLIKPFECVGTKHELRVALNLEKDEKLLKFWSNKNNLPYEFKKILYREI